MKKILSIIIVGICVIILCTVCTNFKNNTIPVEKIIYVPVTDTTCVDSLIYYREQLRRTQDSLNAAKDSLGENLFITKYKLARIKYYNDIAAKGNNIKYLRGWINRVLND
jgi:hypothetical protein